MAAAAFGVGASAMRRWTSGRAANFAAWYRASLVANRKGPAAIGAARGWKLLSSPHASRVKRLFRYWNNRFYSGINVIPN